MASRDLTYLVEKYLDKITLLNFKVFEAKKKASSLSAYLEILIPKSFLLEYLADSDAKTNIFRGSELIKDTGLLEKIIEKKDCGDADWELLAYCIEYLKLGCDISLDAPNGSSAKAQNSIKMGEPSPYETGMYSDIKIITSLADLPEQLLVNLSAIDI